ncbi:MAG: hypothetical protein ACI87W_001282 [Halieaceae bacterium]|jgi:hypothetical protein
MIRQRGPRVFPKEDCWLVGTIWRKQKRYRRRWLLLRSQPYAAAARRRYPVM